MVISANSSHAAIGYFGGSFDPIHFGHLRVAIEFAQAFHLQQVALMPCFQSPHRNMPVASAEQRYAMLQLAVEQSEVLRVDGRELLSSQASYTVNSLAAIRQEIGSQRPLYFAMGADAFTHLHQWKNYQQLFELANIVVLHRPGYQLGIYSADLQDRQAQFAGQHVAAGKLYELAVTSLGISSTQIRQALQQEQSIQYLVPEQVASYIQQQRLYQL